MTRHEGYGYKHFRESIVHLYTECPHGSTIAIAKRDTVVIDDLSTMQGLEVRGWCHQNMRAVERRRGGDT